MTDVSTLLSNPVKLALIATAVLLAIVVVLAVTLPGGSLRRDRHANGRVTWTLTWNGLAGRLIRRPDPRAPAE